MDFSYLIPEVLLPELESYNSNISYCIKISIVGIGHRIMTSIVIWIAMLIVKRVIKKMNRQR
jgi:hypothetical protein